MLTKLRHTFLLVAMLALFNLAANASLGQGLASPPQVPPSSATVTAADGHRIFDR